MPENPSRPITLIATIGSSPAVLTEAIWALHQKEIWPVTEIEIITTTHGVKRIEEKLYGTEKNWIKLCDEIGIDSFSIKVPFLTELKGVLDDRGRELDDVRNPQDVRIMAARIQEIVRLHTSNPNKRVFGLLSGGRETMRSHLMSAMQLFGRRDDHLFHVLVSEPYENIENFYYPTKESKPLTLTINGGENEGYNARDAQIDLIDIPYFRLRPFLETQIDYSKSFDELLAEADEKLIDQANYPVHDLRVYLNGSQSMVYVNGKEHGLKLEPRQISILALFVWMSLKQGEPVAIQWKDVINDQDRREALHIFYRTAREGNFLNIDESKRKINIEGARDEDDWFDYDYWHNEEDQPMKRSFPKQKSELFKALKAFLVDTDLNDIKPEHILRESSTKNRTIEKVIRMPVPVKYCHIDGLHEKDKEILGLE